MNACCGRSSAPRSAADLFNEALGSTCQYSVYDRVKGRKGDVPDETVGAHEEAEH